VSVVSFHSSVTAEKIHFGAVEGDRIEFHGDAAEGSRAVTERTNLPPAVTPHSSYRDIRVDLVIDAELDPQAAEPPRTATAP
jgi:hypothetical protein